MHLVQNDIKGRKKDDTCGYFPQGCPRSFADPMFIVCPLAVKATKRWLEIHRGWMVQIALTSIECRMVCSSGNFYNSELSTNSCSSTAGRSAVSRLRCYGSAPPTESCHRGVGVAVVALALPSLQGDNVMPPGLVAVATANQVWLIQHIWERLSLNKSWNGRRCLISPLWVFWSQTSLANHIMIRGVLRCSWDPISRGWHASSLLHSKWQYHTTFNQR